MSKTPLQTFWDDHVAPALEAWRSEPLDMHLAMTASVNLYHAADYYWNTRKEADADVGRFSSAGAFRAHIATENADFAILRDVAEAHKHMTLDRARRLLTSSAQTARGSVGWGEVPWGEGPWDGPSIVIELDDRSKRHLSAVVDSVETLWKSTGHVG